MLLSIKNIFVIFQFLTTSIKYYCDKIAEQVKEIQYQTGLDPHPVKFGLLSVQPQDLVLFSDSFFYSRTLYQHHILFDKFVNRSHFVLKYWCHTDLTALILTTIKSAIENGGVYHEHDTRGNCITKYYATHSSAIGTFNKAEEPHKKYHQFSLCVIWRFWEFITAYPVGPSYIQSEWWDIAIWDNGVEYPKGEGYDHTEDSYPKIGEEEKASSKLITS